MRIIVFILLLFSSNFAISQSEIKISNRITLIEEYKVKGYKTPDSILFYSGGHKELKKFYEVLFLKLEKELKNTEIKKNFEFDENSVIPINVSSFEELELDFTDNKYKTICVFGINNFGFELSDDPYSPSRIKLCFYMVLIESETNKVLLKRKYDITAKGKYYNENKKLAIDIAKEIIEES